MGISIKPIASGSMGNCYLASCNKTHILLDCGIPMPRICSTLWSIGKELSEIDACLVTHEHGDHVKSAQKLADRGVEICVSRGTIEAAGLSGRMIHEVAPQRTFYIRDGTACMGFSVEHDAAEPLGFFVRFTPEEVLVYITDTAYCKYKLDGVTHLMIEANYDPDIIVGNIEDGAFPASHARRVMSSHMSIEATLLTLERMDRSKLKEVWLLHLSNDNAGGNFKRRVQELCGCEVYVA